MPNESRGNYFALPRLIQKIRGRNAARSEGNWIEAYLAGSAVYLISYLFGASLFWPKLHSWRVATALVLLVPGVWLAWLIVLYLHSLIVKLCWAFGACTDLSRNRIQSVLMGIVTTAFAAQLLTTNVWWKWVGALWLVAVTLNLTAAFLVALFYEERN